MKLDGETPYKGSNEMLKHLRALDAQKRAREEAKALRGEMTEMQFVAVTAKWENS